MDVTGGDMNIYAEGYVKEDDDDDDDDNDYEEEELYILNKNCYEAAKNGNLDQVTLLIEQGVDKDKPYTDPNIRTMATSRGVSGGRILPPAGYTLRGYTLLTIASKHDQLPVVRYLVEQGADMEKADADEGMTALTCASYNGHIDVIRYLLEQGADRDHADGGGDTALHMAARSGHLEPAKLLMVYGADLDAENEDGDLPIEVARDEEIRQAIRDEPRRRMDEAPGKRATEQDRHPNAVASASTQQDEDEGDEEEPSNKKPRLGEVAEEDQDSEPSDEEDDSNGKKWGIGSY